MSGCWPPNSPPGSARRSTTWPRAPPSSRRRSASATIPPDDELDELHRDLYSRLVDGHWTHGTESAVDMALLGRYYERFGDHGVSIGHRVRFLVTGEQPAGDLPD